MDLCIRLATSVFAGMFLGAHVGLVTMGTSQNTGLPTLSLAGGLVARVVALSSNPEFPEFAVVLDRGGSQRVVRLNSRLFEVSRLVESPGGLLLVLGSTGHAHTVTVVDPVAVAIRDHMSGLHPLLSPDGRFVTFWNHRTRDDPPSAVTRVYDTALPPARNRVPGVLAEDEYSVGIPVYPLSNLERRRADPIFDDGLGEVKGQLSCGWLTPAVLAFLDRRGNRAPMLVVVDLEHGLERPAVHVASLDARVILDADAGSGGDDPWLPPSLSATTITLLGADAGSLRVRVDWERRRHPGSRSQVFEFAR